MNRRVLPALFGIGALAAVAIALFAFDREQPEDRGVEAGVVVAIDAVSLTEVLSFDLRTADGRTIKYLVGPLENPDEFPPAHLSVHLADGVPVRVTYVRSGDDRVAVRLEDAAESP